MNYHKFLKYIKREACRITEKSGIVKSGAGFTLIEVLMALAVITIGLVIVLQVFPVGMNVERSNQLETQGALLAQEKIESLLGESYSDVAIGTVLESALASPNEKFSRNTAVSYVNANLQGSASDTGLKKIEVTVSWKSPLKTASKEVKAISLYAQK